MRYLTISLLAGVALAPAAYAETERLPWHTFAQANTYVVNADAVACPDSPTERVLRALFLYAGDRYAYMAKDARWVLWRLQKEDLASGETAPDHVWFGDQNATGSADVMHVVIDMTYEEAARHFSGPCSWLDRGQMMM